MPVIIHAERPDTPDAASLIEELEAHLGALYPSESRHGFSIERLISEHVAFFVLREDGAAAGCGGVKLFDTEFGEIKRMYVRPQYRGKGFAKRILTHLSDYALVQGVTLLRLETGIHQHEAIRLYEQMGFYRIGPFKGYQPDPNSLFFEKSLTTSAASTTTEAAAG